MKKHIVILLLFVLCIAVVPCSALASTTEEEICKLVTDHQKVKNANCVVFERNCIIALQTEKFTNKSEYTAFVDQLKSQICKNYQIDNVVATRNPKIMQQLEKLQNMDEGERNKLIEQLLEKLSKKPMPLPYFEYTKSTSS